VSLLAACKEENGEDFEDKEHEMFGKNGFEEMVGKSAK
jgi:hypothetical protein